MGQTERAFLGRDGVTASMLGELELAHGIMRHALHHGGGSVS
jgi:hypothetical protein